MIYKSGNSPLNFSELNDGIQVVLKQTVLLQMNRMTKWPLKQTDAEGCFLGKPRLSKVGERVEGMGTSAMLDVAWSEILDLEQLCCHARGLGQPGDGDQTQPRRRGAAAGNIRRSGQSL